MTKPTKWECDQPRLRSAWASTQSDQSSLCAQWVVKDPRFLQADSGDWSVWAEFVGFVKSWLIYGAVLTQQLPESKFFSVKASHTQGSCYWVSLSYRSQSHVFRKSRHSTPRTEHLGSPPELSGRQTVHLGNPAHTVGYLDLKEIINRGQMRRWKFYIKMLRDCVILSSIRVDGLG